VNSIIIWKKKQSLQMLLLTFCNIGKFPILARMARDILAVPASMVASESAFSSGEKIINDYRSRLTSETVEALICLQNWIRGKGNGMSPMMK
jgi:hypothetical protein